MTLKASVYSQSNTVCQEKIVSCSVHRERERQRKKEAVKVYDALLHDALGVLRRSTPAMFSKNVIKGLAASV